MVQRVAPEGSGVALEEDYHTAVVRVALSEHDDLRHLFATIELLPEGMPSPGDAKEASAPLPGGTLRFLRWVCTVAEGVAFHRRLAEGGMFPLDELPLPLASFGKPFTLGLMSTEPRWPSLIQSLHDLPFLSQWHGRPRVHHALRLDPRVDTDPLRLERITAWVSERFFFRAEQYPELLGSAHLIAPDPVLASVTERLLDPDGSHEGESIVVALDARPGKSVEGLRLQVISHGPTGVRAMVETVVRQPLVRVDFDHPLHQVETRILDDRRGVLTSTGPGVFIRSVAVQTQPAGLPTPGSDADRPPVRARATEALLQGMKRRAQASRQSARELFEGGDSWGRVEGEILADVHRYLLVVMTRLTASDLARLHAWAERAWTTLYALADEIVVSEAPSRSETSGEVEVRRMSRLVPIEGNFLVTEHRAWVFTGSLAALGEVGSFVHEVTEASALSDRFLAAWHAGHPLPASASGTYEGAPARRVGSAS